MKTLNRVEACRKVKQNIGTVTKNACRVGFEKLKHLLNEYKYLVDKI